MNHWMRKSLPGAVIIFLVVVAYIPALNGGFVWDDDAWTTNISGLFEDFSGLYSIWTEPTALQQYYPISGTTFWLDYQLWEFWTLPYHIENVLLHALCALLFWRLLTRLQLPGAWLAAAIFALHPVMVESAAWITERKNVLSLAFYLGALLAYGHLNQFWQGDTRGNWKSYAVALLLFLGALLSKTTTFSLPAVILLLVWWKRGVIRWKTDVLPTLPFFALAIGMCLLTAWLEKTHVGARGPDFAFTFLERCLIAGRVPWFYIGKLLWPAQLCLIYPRWQPNPEIGWQWLYPLSTVGAVLVLWFMRKRLGRGPVTAALFFLGTLFPVLGFMNAFGMRYSFVWDHWVYLSSMALIAPAAALVARAANCLGRPVVLYGFAAVVLPVLFMLTWRQCGMYSDIETLWHTTIARNPNCWMAYNNLGMTFSDRGNFPGAERLYRAALRINPQNPESHYNLGNVLIREGRLDEAIQQFELTLQLQPDFANGYNNLGTALANQHKYDEAIQQFKVALQLGAPEARNNLDAALRIQSVNQSPK